MTGPSVGCVFPSLAFGLDTRQRLWTSSGGPVGFWPDASTRPEVLGWVTGSVPCWSWDVDSALESVGSFGSWMVCWEAFPCNQMEKASPSRPAATGHAKGAPCRQLPVPWASVDIGPLVREKRGRCAELRWPVAEDPGFFKMCHWVKTQDCL